MEFVDNFYFYFVFGKDIYKIPQLIVNIQF